MSVCRGVTVATTLLDERDRRAGAKQIAAKDAGDEIVINLPPEVDGQIDVELFDRSSQEAQLVERQTVFRQPQHNSASTCLPRKSVTILARKCSSRSRSSMKAAAAGDTRLGIRVWNEQLVQQADEQPLLWPTPCETHRTK